MFYSSLNLKSTRLFLTILFFSFMNPATADWRSVLEDLQKDIQQGATEAVKEIGDVVTGNNTDSQQVDTTESTLPAPREKKGEPEILTGEIDYLGGGNQSEHTPAKVTSELSKEAKEFHDRCSYSMYEKISFDCDCMTELYERELVSEEGFARYMGEGIKSRNRSNYASYLQSSIYTERKNNCVRPDKIAQHFREDCVRSLGSSSALGMFKSGSKELENVCSCVGNTTAKRFSETPIKKYSTPTRKLNVVRGKALDACISSNRESK